MESWRLYRPVVADSHHFEEELDPDQHLKSKLKRFLELKIDPWTLALEIALKMKPWTGGYSVPV